MATITKRTSTATGRVTYRAQVRMQGIVKSATFHTKADAERWANAVEIAISSDDFLTVPDIPFSYVIERYMREITPQKKSRRHETRRLLRLQAMPIAQVSVRDLTKQHFIQWRDQRLAEVSAGSVRREWATVGNLLKIAVNEWGLVKTDYLAQVRKPPEPKARTRRYSASEINALIYVSGFSWNQPPETATARVALAILFALETAMRAGEIVGLTWEHVHFDRRIAHLPETKNGYARDVPLSLQAVKILQKLQEIEPSASVFQLTSTNLDALFRKLRDKANLGDSNLRFHDTRREALTRLAKKLDVMTLAKMSGHRDLKILQNTYYAPDMSQFAHLLD